MQALEVRDLSRRYGNRTVLDQVSFTLHAGQIGAVVGPNGAGKTTLLRCVVGADRPAAGDLTIDSRHPPSINRSWPRARPG